MVARHSQARSMSMPIGTSKKKSHTSWSELCILASTYFYSFFFFWRMPFTVQREKDIKILEKPTYFLFLWTQCHQTPDSKLFEQTTAFGSLTHTLSSHLNQLISSFLSLSFYYLFLLLRLLLRTSQLNLPPPKTNQPTKPNSLSLSKK